MNSERLKNQLNFIIEADKVKNILRKTKLFDSSRFENDAEHSWTVCLMAVLLKEYSNFEVSIEKVLIMLLIHDLVEIGAGDTFLYAKERDTAYKNEEESAKKIFGMLPAEQAEYFYSIWKEFEERKTNESKFASVFDRFEPILQNYKTEGYTWKKHGITKSMVMEKNKHISEGSNEIWEFFLTLIDESVKKGWLEDK
jgi:putative hydrolases of HD superfamily